jgi:hypothetical protein
LLRTTKTSRKLKPKEDEIYMKTRCLMLALALSAGAFAQNNPQVRWNRIVGVITAPGVDNPVGVAPNQIHSGAGPWTTRGGSARINLNSGEGSFEVEGLVLNGGNASGTPGPINSVVGTLVCNAGTATQANIDTPATELSSSGDAELSFRLTVPAACSNPLFLIRLPQAGLKWIATGTVPVSQPNHY